MRGSGIAAPATCTAGLHQPGKEERGKMEGLRFKVFYNMLVCDALLHAIILQGKFFVFFFCFCFGLLPL